MNTRTHHAQVYTVRPRELLCLRRICRAVILYGRRRFPAGEIKKNIKANCNKASDKELGDDTRIKCLQLGLARGMWRIWQLTTATRKRKAGANKNEPTDASKATRYDLTCETSIGRRWSVWRE